jgi:hypothetical protein
MAFTTALMAQSAGRAAPLAYLIGGVIVTLVGISFVAFGRQVAHAGSVYAYVGSVLGSRCGFVAGWALMLMYVTLLAGSTALVGNFGAAERVRLRNRLLIGRGAHALRIQPGWVGAGSRRSRPRTWYAGAFHPGDGHSEPGLFVLMGSAIRRGALRRQHCDDRHLGSYLSVYRRHSIACDRRVPQQASGSVDDWLPQRGAAPLAAMEQLVSSAPLAGKYLALCCCWARLQPSFDHPRSEFTPPKLAAHRVNNQTSLVLARSEISVLVDPSKRAEPALIKDRVRNGCQLVARRDQSRRCKSLVDNGGIADIRRRQSWKPGSRLTRKRHQAREPSGKGGAFGGFIHSSPIELMVRGTSPPTRRVRDINST